MTQSSCYLQEAPFQDEHRRLDVAFVLHTTLVVLERMVELRMELDILGVVLVYHAYLEQNVH